jgi:hypothetical protein
MLCVCVCVCVCVCSVMCMCVCMCVRVCVYVCVCVYMYVCVTPVLGNLSRSPVGRNPCPLSAYRTVLVSISGERKRKKKIILVETSFREKALAPGARCVYQHAHTDTFTNLYT